MPINFFPKDPAVAQLPLTQVEPFSTITSPVRVVVDGASDVAALPHPLTSREFRLRHCQHALDLTMSAIEAISSSSVSNWAARTGGGSVLHATVDEGFLGADAISSYDEAGIRFARFIPSGSNALHSASSVDIISHECGHALLDALRPDLWSKRAVDFEIAGFHEGFADALAFLVSLSNAGIRTALISQVVDLRNPNYCSVMAPSLAAAARYEWGAGHELSTPRSLLNSYIYPADEDWSGFTIWTCGQIVSGAVYDLVAELYSSSPQTADDLWAAALAVGKLLVEGARRMQQDHAGFLRQLKAAMIDADISLFGSANRAVIESVFLVRGIS